MICIDSIAERLTMPSQVVQTLVYQLDENLDSVILELRESIEGEHFSKAIEHAHSIAGVAGNLLISEVAKSARLLVELLRKGEGDVIGALESLESAREQFKSDLSQMRSNRDGLFPNTVDRRKPYDQTQMILLLKQVLEAIEHGDVFRAEVGHTALMNMDMPRALESAIQDVSKALQRYQFDQAKRGIFGILNE